MNKKVLFITHYSELYGANRSMLESLVFLNHSKVKIKVITTNYGGLCEKLEKLGIDYNLIPFKPVGAYRWRSSNKVFQAFRDIEFLFKGILFNLKNLYFGKKILDIIRKEKIQIVYYNSLMSLSFGLQIILKKSGVKTILHIREDIAGHYNIYPFLGWKILNALLNSIDSVIMVSDYINNIYKSLIPEEKIKLIPNSIDFEFKEVYYDKTAFTFGVFGMVSAKKNQFIALKALEYLIKEGNKVRLLVVGGGDIETLKRLSKELKIHDHVDFTGFVENMNTYYNKVDACLICSENEAFGRVTIEALLCKKPIIANFSGATPEILSYGSYGEFFCGDYRHLAEKMKFMMENFQLYQIMAERGFKHAIKKYSYPKSQKIIFETLSAF